MKHSRLKMPARLERQMKAARQLRAETLASGFACAIGALLSVVRGAVGRFRPVWPNLIRSD